MYLKPLSRWHAFPSFRYNSLSYVRQLNSIGMELILRESVLLELQRFVQIVELDRIEVHHPTILVINFKIGVQICLLLNIGPDGSPSDFTQLPTLQAYN
jgi:hypothetical protein